jgi:hypothetical protein
MISQSALTLANPPTLTCADYLVEQRGFELANADAFVNLSPFEGRGDANGDRLERADTKSSLAALYARYPARSDHSAHGRYPPNLTYTAQSAMSGKRRHRPSVAQECPDSGDSDIPLLNK